MLPELRIGDKTAALPIIQGGMGVGVSRSGLAGAVAKEGGIGIISTAQIGYDEEGFEQNPAECNLKAIRKHIKKAKDIAGGNGMVGVNVMVALKHYKEHVKEAVKAGADVIICGAGLPVDLPELVKEGTSKIAPIVSSARASSIILKMWDHKYKRTADFLVVEGPMAGGHLGYSREQLSELDNYDFDEEIKKILDSKKQYEEKYNCSIPVIVGGGIFDHKDIEHILSLGADGVQMATRFVATEECDADILYKQAYLNTKAEDIDIVVSPVGMPGRAVHNKFIESVENGRKAISKCYQCLEKCNPANVPYCITKALTDAVRGNVDEGLIFCGSNADRINSITTVHQLMVELAGEN
ncbi:MAG: nitronate monooxygenase family protein [Lachnospiraceae bacterium]|nr:nitronate monooxygenase family protein [Lachnospiraceae bacterium]